MDTTLLADYVEERNQALLQQSRVYTYRMSHALPHKDPADFQLAYAISEFGRAVYNKARLARDKYNFPKMGWATPDWQAELQNGLAEHLLKGDPRDVGVYAAFAYFHGWPTAPQGKGALELVALGAGPAPTLAADLVAQFNATGNTIISTAPPQIASIKTYRAWEDGPEMPFDKFVQPGDEVDEEMVNHFGGIVSPQYCTQQFTQVGEPEHEENGRYFHATFGKFGDRYLYLGVLPPFKQPKY